MTTISIILISILTVLVIVLGFTSYNLLKKYEAVEDVVNDYDTYITEFSNEVTSIEKRIKEIDAKGTFEGDDEIVTANVSDHPDSSPNSS